MFLLPPLFRPVLCYEVSSIRTPLPSRPRGVSGHGTVSHHLSSSVHCSSGCACQQSCDCAAAGMVSSPTMMFLVFWHFLVFAPASAFEVQKKIEVKAGEDATLECQCPRDATIKLLEWSRPELKQDGYVFFYRNSRPYENYQHQSFVGRVELRKESSVRDGDVSVILKNVNISDAGTYECRIILGNTGSSGSAPTELKQLITLKVSESGNNWDGGIDDPESKNERRGAALVPIAVGLMVVAVVLVGIVLFIYFLYRRQNTEQYSKPGEQLSDPTKI